MGKLFNLVRRPRELGRFVKTLAAVAGACTLLAPGLSFACDDDYPAPASWAPYQQQPAVVMVDPRAQYDRDEGWRHERAARAYWSWRGHQREYGHRHHHRGHWD